MRTRCHFPGCSNNGSTLKNLNSAFKQSTHLVPKKQTSNVARLLNIPYQKGVRLFICSAHLRKDSFIFTRNGFRDLRPDVPFVQLLKLTKTEEVERKPVIDPSSLGRIYSAHLTSILCSLFISHFISLLVLSTKSHHPCYHAS